MSLDDPSRRHRRHRHRAGADPASPTARRGRSPEAPTRPGAGDRTPTHRPARGRGPNS